MPRHRFLAAFALFLAATSLAPAQDKAPLPQFLQALKPRSIGPANMSGRIVDVAVYDKEPRIQYVASATGGLWKTTNHGTTWKPVFDRASTVALGAVAVCQTNPDLVWVGTGEANARNSVSWGDGVYKSTDGGKSWQDMGLKDSHHIGRIVIHPKNMDIVYVAALGHLWGPNLQRGVFKSSDAGKTWTHSLAIDQQTGAIDLAIDPQEPDILYAAMYHVRRDAFSGGNPAVQTGPGAGLYRTADGGKSWEQIKNGLPDRPFGRCGLSVYAKDPKVVYAVVQTDKTAVSVQGQGANSAKIGPEAGGIFRSDDKGKSWKRINSLVPRPFYYGQIRVDPSDDKRIYVLGINFFMSADGGKKFIDGNSAKGTHVDYHALWIDPRDSHHLILGCDGGLNYSWDRSETWEHLKNLPVSQFYAIAVDSNKPFKVYGGLQDNGDWGGPSATHDVLGITIADWINVLGFDGYYCQVDPKDNDTVYAEGQYGILRRVAMKTGALTDIKPRLSDKNTKTNIAPDPGKHAGFRFNWSTPMQLSPHNGKTLWYAANYLFRSENRGDTWAIVSPDLTHGKPGPNDYSGHTISTFAESPVKAGLVYVGTDDGRLWITRDAGEKWTELSSKVPNLPYERWITRVEPSRYAEGTVYLTIDRHRNDDFGPYVYRSTDFGKTWTSLADGLPHNGPVQVIREDLVNKDLLYVGTEFGLFLSLDAGKTWHRQSHLPTVPVHDLVVHPRERELVIATHGRGIWIMDVRPLQESTAKALAEPAHLFTVPTAEAFRTRIIHNLGIKMFRGDNPPYGAGIYIHLRDMPKEQPVVTITDKAGKKMIELKGEKSAGLQRLAWRLNLGGPPGLFRPVPAGQYTATLRVGDLELRREFRVEVQE